jgi:hypothetical protein
MNCEWVKENGSLYLYDELLDDARHELEHHLSKCKACAEDMEALRGFHLAMSQTMPVQEPSANLLTDSRMKLQEALEHAEQKSSWRWTLDVASWFHQIRFSPALAGVLLMAGFAGGAVATFTAQSNKSGKGVSVPFISSEPAVDSASIGSIKGISQDPGSNKVSIQYERLVPDQVQGNINDPQVQQLLLYAARSNYNSGVRLDSINVLSQEPQDQAVREALIFSLRYDKNPGVRLKAMESLKPYVKEDVRVRDAVLEALLRDSNPGVRSEAIRALRPVSVDTSVRQTLEVLAERDENKYIRGESRRVLASLPEIQ